MVGFKLFRFVCCGLGLFLASMQAVQAEQSENIDPNLEGEMNRLFEEISRSPDNLDSNYRYAQVAAKLGQYYKSIAAYERMLIQNPNLHRVKLDLAVLYAQVGSNQAARKLFLEVKETNPPAQVVANIDEFLLKLGQKISRHKFGGSVTLGYTSDSNPNAAPNSGAVDVFGVGIPVDDSVTDNADDQKFAQATLSHRYSLENNKSINTTASFYKSVQDNARALNTTVYSLKTGISGQANKGRLRYGANANCSRVNLAEHEYLNSHGYDVFVDYILSRKHKIRASHAHEKRNFKNSPTVTTYDDRDGRANEQKISLTSLITPKDIVNVNVGFRREHAAVDYYTNRSRSVAASYTKMFDKDWYLNVSHGYKRTNYKDVDTFVNPFVVRKDTERTTSIGIGRNITSQLTCGFVYQDKKIKSNIQNYSYENQRVTASMTFRF